MMRRWSKTAADRSVRDNNLELVSKRGCLPICFRVSDKKRMIVWYGIEWEHESIMRDYIANAGPGDMSQGEGLNKHAHHIRPMDCKAVVADLQL